MTQDSCDPGAFKGLYVLAYLYGPNLSLNGKTHII